jgi:hypothetical protein
LSIGYSTSLCWTIVAWLIGPPVGNNKLVLIFLVKKSLDISDNKRNARQLTAPTAKEMTSRRKEIKNNFIFYRRF